MENGKWKMKSLPVIGCFCLLLCGLVFPAASNNQSCNPAVVSYIVRDETGKVLGATELKTLAEQLPKQIGDATTSVNETSFAPDKRTYYWQESVEWEKGERLPSLQFSNAGICAMRFGEVRLRRNEKTMRLIFDIEILRFQQDRRPVIDSLPFQNGTFRLDLKNWTHEKDKMIPASHWKRIRVR
jgi:hypothetical protein